MGGTKYDLGKTRLDLIPAESVEAIGRVFTYGSIKYKDRNWEDGISYGRIYRATLSHLIKWWLGRPCDDESGMSHLWHAGCCILMLISYEIRRHTEFDDRQEPVTIEDIDAFGSVKEEAALVAKKTGKERKA